MLYRDGFKTKARIGFILIGHNDVTIWHQIFWMQFGFVNYSYILKAIQIETVLISNQIDKTKKDGTKMDVKNINKYMYVSINS